MAQTVETRTEVITLGDDGVIRCRVKPTEAHTLEDAVENVRATAGLVGGRRAPFLLDARAATGISREARLYYTGAENAKVVLAIAMLIGSPAGRIIGNFLIRVNQPRFPFRLFTEEAAALIWLSGLSAGRGDDGG